MTMQLVALDWMWSRDREMVLMYVDDYVGFIFRLKVMHGYRTGTDVYVCADYRFVLMSLQGNTWTHQCRVGILGYIPEHILSYTDSDICLKCLS